MRLLGERKVFRSQWRLLACASILRTAVTRVLPLAGAAGWWVMLVSLLPGFALYLLGCWGLKRSGRAKLHGLAGPMSAAALLVDAVSAMTALITLFTEGIGTQGTQLTLALVASGMLLFCLKKEGLARGIYFLQWPLLVMLVLVTAGYLVNAKVDHLFPVLGSGKASLWAAFRAGIGAGWVFLLPLMEEPAGRHRAMEPLAPVLLCIGVLVCVNLCIPHELLTVHQSLGDSMTQTIAHLTPTLRLVCICLWLVGLFLSIGSSCSLSAGYALAPDRRELVWLPWLLAVLVAAAQALPTRSLWQSLGYAEPWMVAVLGAGMIFSFGRRK